MKIGPMLEPKCVHGKSISERCRRCEETESDIERECLLITLTLVIAPIATLCIFWYMAGGFR